MESNQFYDDMQYDNDNEVKMLRGGGMGQSVWKLWLWIMSIVNVLVIILFISMAVSKDARTWFFNWINPATASGGGHEPYTNQLNFVSDRTDLGACSNNLVQGYYKNKNYYKNKCNRNQQMYDLDDCCGEDCGKGMYANDAVLGCPEDKINYVEDTKLPPGVYQDKCCKPKCVPSPQSSVEIVRNGSDYRLM